VYPAILYSKPRTNKYLNSPSPTSIASPRLTLFRRRSLNTARPSHAYLRIYDENNDRALELIAE